MKIPFTFFIFRKLKRMQREVNQPIVIRRKNGETVEFKTINDYNSYIKDIIIKADLKVLRDKLTGEALNVSYTEDGLKTTANKTGRYIYFKNVTRLEDIPKGKMSDRVIVESFVPRTFQKHHLNKAEIHWIKAAKHKIDTNG